MWGMTEDEARELARDIFSWIDWVTDADAVDLRKLDLGPGWGVVVRFKPGKRKPHLSSVFSRDEAVAAYGWQVDLGRGATKPKEAS